MRRLILCDTYYQLLIAIQLRLTLFQGDSVSVWLSDHTEGAEEVVKKIKVQNCFQDVRFVATKNNVYQKSKVKSILDILKYNFAFRTIEQVELYDEIIFYNLTLMVYAIEDWYAKVGHTVIWSRMEEGLFSYETDLETGFRVNASRFLRKILPRNDVADLIQNYYCFFPELKKGHREWNRIKIPSIETCLEELKRILNAAFDYSSQVITQKYIFFASSSDVDGNPYGETELVQALAQKIGAQNLLVKMHPRDTRDVYKRMGISVMEQSSIPWEVIQLNWKESKKLVTVNSGAFISICALFNKNSEGYFLYPSIQFKGAVFQKRKLEINDMLIRLHQHKIALNISAIQLEEIE